MKDKQVLKQKHRKKLKLRSRKKINGTSERPRLVVFRANSNISLQLVDDIKQVTIATVNTVASAYDSLKKSGKGKIALSRQVGIDAAKLAEQHKITKVVFDRNGFKYHGRIKAVADGAREGGLKF